MSERDLALLALEALPHGLTVVDVEGRLVFSNTAFWRNVGVPRASFPAGGWLRDLVRLLAFRGYYGPGDPEAQAEAVLGLDRSRPLRRQLASPDGARNLEMLSVPLPGGGFVSVAHDITNLVRAREEQESRARLLESTLAGLSGGVARYDADLRLSLFNPAYEALLGLPGGTVRPGMTPADIVTVLDARGEYVSDEDRLVVASLLEGSREKGGTRLRQRLGGPTLRFATKPMDGGFLLEVTDITALKRAEDEARRRAGLLDGVLAMLPHAVIVYGPDNRVAVTNAAYARLMEGDPIAVGEHIEDIVRRRLASGEYDDATAQTVLARFDPSRPVPPLMRRVRPNGTVLENCVARLPDGGMISVFTDVTALHRAEEAARQRAALLDGVLEAMPYGVLVFDRDRRVAMFNRAYERIMQGTTVAIGDPLEEIIARRVAQGEYGQDYASITRLRHAGADSYGTKPRRVRPNGTVIEGHTAPLPDGRHLSVVTDVTALHIAEETARDRADLLDTVLEALPDGVCVYAPDRRARMTNAAYRRILGEAGAQPGESLDEVLERRVKSGELTREMGDDMLRRHFGPDGEVGRPIRRLRPNGTAIVSRAARLPDGGYISVVSDVTALHQAEEELQRRATTLEASFAAIPHGIAVFGSDRRLRASNRRLVDLLPLPPEELKQGSSFEAIAEALVRHGLMVAEDARVCCLLDRTQPQRYQRALAAGRTLEIVSEPMRDGGFVMVYNDITDLLAAQAEARHRAAMQEMMLGTIRHGIIMYGPDRRIRASNARASSLTGAPPESLVPGRLLDELADEQASRGETTPAQAEMMKALDRSVPQRYSRQRPDGRVLEVASEPTPDGGFAITYSDVTEDRMIRAELERARLQAEAASEAKSRFLATMSHELRTPLNAIIGFSDAMGMERDHARISDYAALINEAGRHLLQLVDDILDVARSQSGALPTADQPVEVGEVLRSAAAAACGAAATGGVTLRALVPPGLPHLRGDARRLRQVIDKLLSNAVKFTGHGGHVVLTARAGAQGMEIRVSDTGVGIPPEERERMFEPFTQLDNSLARRFQGSGLGLHLARQLASALGGSVTLEDPVEGPGIVAVLRFPVERLVPLAQDAAGTPA